MKLKKICKYYKDCIETFGFWDGCRVFFAFVSAEFRNSGKKKLFTVGVPGLGKECLYLRKNSTDIYLAMQLLRKDGEYAFLFQEPYKKMLQHAEVVVDAGANIGLFSVLCQSVNETARYICIEPEKGNYDSLVKNVPRGGILKRACGIKKQIYLLCREIPGNGDLRLKRRMEMNLELIRLRQLALRKLWNWKRYSGLTF